MRVKETISVSMVNIRKTFSLAPSSVKRLIIGNIFDALSYFLRTYILARIFAELVSEATTATISNFAVTTVILFAFLLVLGAVSTFMMRNAVIGLDVALKEFVVKKSVHGELRQNGETDERVSVLLNDIPLITESVETVLSIVLEVAVWGFGGMILILFVSPLIGVAVLALQAINLIYSLFFAKKLYRATQNIQEKAAALLRTVKEMLEGTILLRFFLPKGTAGSRYDAAAEQRAKAGTHRAVVSGALGGINNAALKFSSLVLYLASAVCLFSGQLSQALFLQVVQWAELAVGSFMFSRELVEIEKSMVGANRIWHMLDSIQCETGGQQEQQSLTQKIIEFENVDFSYGENEVLKQESFFISCGDFVVITGKSGGGKTTVLRLILGLIFPSSGNVLVNGLATNDWNLKALRKLITVVPQENDLFSGTIRENIIMDQDVTESEMKEAAKSAGASEFIEALPNGYDTVVSEHGDTLSGGQKQRISIARAIVRKAPIILFDEASSAIDEKLENSLLETLQKIRQGRTIVFVSHRQQTIEAGDRTIAIG